MHKPHMEIICKCKYRVILILVEYSFALPICQVHMCYLWHPLCQINIVSGLVSITFHKCWKCILPSHQVHISKSSSPFCQVTLSTLIGGTLWLQKASYTYSMSPNFGKVLWICNQAIMQWQKPFSLIIQGFTWTS